jgi:hypothetical protein
MKKRFLLAAGLTLISGAASAQYYPATYQQPYCREFTKAVNVGGRVQSAYGQACMQPDGSWQVVSDQIPAAQPVQYIPAQNQVVYVERPVPTSVFSLSFGNWNPYRTRYYNNYGHGWRDQPWNDRGRGYDNRGRGNGWGHGHH